MPRGARLRPRLAEAFSAEIAHLQSAAGHSIPVVEGRPLGTGLLAYSPQFARFVRGSAGTMPDPNNNPVLALSLLLSVPVVDRTGVITDPDVKVTVLDPLPPPGMSARQQAALEKVGSAKQGHGAWPKDHLYTQVPTEQASREPDEP